MCLFCDILGFCWLILTVFPQLQSASISGIKWPPHLMCTAALPCKMRSVTLSWQKRRHCDTLFFWLIPYTHSFTFYISTGCDINAFRVSAGQWQSAKLSKCCTEIPDFNLICGLRTAQTPQPSWLSDISNPAGICLPDRHPQRWWTEKVADSVPVKFWPGHYRHILISRLVEWCLTALSAQIGYTVPCPPRKIIL